MIGFGGDFPQFIQGPYVAQGAGRFELDRWQRGIQVVGATSDFDQPGDDRIEAARDLIKVTQSDQRAMLGLVGVVTKSSTRECVRLIRWGLRFKARGCCLRLPIVKSQIAAFSFRH